MDKFVWPSRLPYPISWVRACVNLMVASFFGQVAWESLRDAIRRGEVHGAASLRSYILISWLLLLFLHFLCITLGHHWIVQKLLCKRSAWWPGWSSWREGLTGSVVLLVQTFGTGFLVFSLAFLFNPGSEQQVKIFLTVVGATWVTLAAYLYQYDFRVRQQRAAKLSQAGNGKQVSKAPVKGEHQPPKPAPTPTPPPIDPIDLELQQLREQIRKMNPDQ